LFKSVRCRSSSPDFRTLPDSRTSSDLFSTLQIVQNVFFATGGPENRVFFHRRPSQSVQNVQLISL
jgi:hypothetical protein